MKAKVILILSSLLLLSFLSLAQSLGDSLNLEIAKIHQKSSLPGFAISIINKDGIVFSKGYGYSNTKDKIDYTTKTIQNIGSISKTFIGVALMKLVDQGKLDLNTDINDVLPFKIINPKNKEGKITIRHLATHTSGLVESSFYNKICYVLEEDPAPYLNQLSGRENKIIKVVSGNSKMELGDFLEAYFVKGGKYYKKKNFSKHTPGTKYKYSNIGSALAAYIVEIIAEKDFRDFVAEEIFHALKMENSTYDIKQINDLSLAKNYSSTGAPFPKYSLVTYPDGGVYTNNYELSLYFNEMIKGMNGTSSLLSIPSFENMFDLQFDDGKNRTSLFWDHTKGGSIGHNGADPGIFTYMYYSKRNIGMVFTCNTFSDKDKSMMRAVQEILQTAHNYGRKF